jgi:PleD family two-component response regulator
MRILIVDGSEDSRDLTEAALLSAGYDDIAAVDSAEAAYDFLAIGKGGEAVAVDVILLDILIPGIGGFQACEAIRRDGRYTDIPIIMVAPRHDMESLAKAFIAGATDYIAKPINRIELLARLRSAVRIKGELTRRLERERQLLDFMATWGSRRGDLWIDEASRLFDGEIAEAWLLASAASGDEPISVIALAIDRFDAYRAVNGSAVADAVLADAGAAVRRLPALIGTVAAIYPNGLMVIVAPGYDNDAASRLAQALRAEVLNLRRPDATDAGDFTVTVATATGNPVRGADRIRLLTQAIGAIHGSATRAGDEAIPMSA